MRLVEAIANIQYDRNWEVWAELVNGRLVPDSEARYGEWGVERGGLSDDFVFVCNGETAGDHIAAWYDNNGSLLYGWFDELIDPINESASWNDG